MLNISVEKKLSFHSYNYFLCAVHKIEKKVLVGAKVYQRHTTTEQVHRQQDRKTKERYKERNHIYTYSLSKLQYKGPLFFNCGINFLLFLLT